MKIINFIIKLLLQSIFTEFVGWHVMISVCLELKMKIKYK